jgi:hypothetical protein
LDLLLKEYYKPSNHAHILTLDHPFYHLLANCFDRFDPLPICLATSSAFSIIGLRGRSFIRSDSEFIYAPIPIGGKVLTLL